MSTTASGDALCNVTTWTYSKKTCCAFLIYYLMKTPAHITCRISLLMLKTCLLVNYKRHKDINYITKLIIIHSDLSEKQTKDYNYQKVINQSFPASYKYQQHLAINVATIYTLMCNNIFWYTVLGHSGTNPIATETTITLPSNELLQMLSCCHNQPLKLNFMEDTVRRMAKHASSPMPESFVLHLTCQNMPERFVLHLTVLSRIKMSPGHY